MQGVREGVRVSIPIADPRRSMLLTGRPLAQELFHPPLKTMTTSKPDMQPELKTASHEPTAWTRIVANLRHSAATTCYLPNAGRDWDPLLPLSQHCSTFVYAGSALNGGKSLESLREKLDQVRDLGWVDNTATYPLDPSVGGLEMAMLGYLEEHRPTEAAAYLRDLERSAARCRQIVEASLCRTNPDQERSIRLLFIEAEALAIYRGVYSAAQLAPQVVVLPRRCPRRMGAVLGGWPRPTLLITAKEDAGAMVGTPWPHLLKELRWGRYAFTQWPLPPSWLGESPPGRGPFLPCPGECEP